MTARQPRQCGRGGPRVHVTKAVPRRPSPFLPRPRPAPGAGLRRSRARKVDNGQPPQSPLPDPLPSPRRPFGRSEGGGGGFQVLRLRAAAQTRLPPAPPPRPRTGKAASDTPAGARPQLPARAGSRPRPLPRRADLEALESSPALGRETKWRVSKGGGLAHAQKAPAPHSGTTLPRSLRSISILDDV